MISRQLRLRGVWVNILEGCPHLWPDSECELTKRPCVYERGHGANQGCDVLREVIEEQKRYFADKEVWNGQANN